MSTSSYLDKRRRRKVKKMVRLQKPYLMGDHLEEEIDRLLGISDSGKMDWAMTKKNDSSKHPTPDSVTEMELREVADGFGLRPYHLYWFYMKKVTKLQAAGRDKHDYLAVLEDIASEAIKKELSDEEKVTAALLFAQFTRVTLTRQQALLMVQEGKL